MYIASCWYRSSFKSVCLSLSLACVIKLLLTFDLDAIKPQPCPREEKADSDDEDKKDDGGRVEMCADLCLLPLKRGQSHVELRLASSGVSVERREGPDNPRGRNLRVLFCMHEILVKA